MNDEIAAMAGALDEAAEWIEVMMGPAWGGDAMWLTSGTKVADLVAEVLRALADEMRDPSEGESRGE